MSTLKTNELEDLYLVDGRNLAIISNLDAAVQTVRQRSKMRLGENQFDVNDGVDYLGTVFDPQPNFDAFRKSLADNLLATTDILDIQTLDISQVGDVVTFDAELLTPFGLAQLTGAT